ncbi:MAG: DUF302 domain-containing protein [Rhodocyclaceae bacterium]|nr:DUF302 domain-containing protein [Rhodocyclaceae bacterium]
MWKILAGLVFGVAVALFGGYSYFPSLMFTERVSPFGVEETVARIQQNIQASNKGWTLSGLRNAAKPIEKDGGNVLPVLMIEACSTRYSGPILKDDTLRFLSILMPCKISVYKKSDGKVYIGTMNASLIGAMFGSKVGTIMKEVAEDQQSFLKFDPTKPAPKMIEGMPGGGGGGAGAGSAGGC